MRERKTASPGFFTMGAPLLLTTLLVLMLVTFSLLRASFAREEQRRAQLMAQRSAAYYSACNQAEAVLNRLTYGGEPDVPLEEQGDTLRFRIPITETQSLSVTLRKENGGYTVMRWTVENP